LDKLPFFLTISIVITILIAISILLFSGALENDMKIPPKNISLIAVGDSIGYNIENEKLSHLSDLVNQNDIFIFNLEGVILESNERVSECEGFPQQSLFTAHSSFLDYMKLSSITIANLGNNHVIDCGSEGLNETKKILSEKNILSLGAGQNIDEACEPLIVKTKGWNIAFVSYNYVKLEFVSAGDSNPGTVVIDQCNHDYDKIRSSGSDLIIASVHDGTWSPDVSYEQTELVNNLFDAGVDIVIGHSPHMPQAIMVKDGKLAFFSLGNFILRPDYEMPELAHTTIMPRIDLYPDRIDVTIFPIRIDEDGIPHLDEKGDIISRIVSVSKNFKTNVDIRNNIGFLSIKK